MPLVTLQLRRAKGATRLQGLQDTSSFHDLTALIEKECGVPASRQQLKIGYPPKPLIATSNQTLSELGIRSGESIVLDEMPEDIPEPIMPPSMPTTHTTPKSPPVASTPPAVVAPTPSPAQTAHQSVQQHAASAPSSSTAENDQNDESGVFIRRIIAADNSCLFNAIGYCLENRNRSMAPTLRKLIKDVVSSDEDLYSEGFLGKPNDLYSSWIMHPESWGGAIELYILSNHYQIEIAVIHIQTLHVDMFGEGSGYTKRCFLLYDGVHYDVICRVPFENASELSDATIFSSTDDLAVVGALSVAETLQQRKEFTDLTGFSLQCGECFLGLKGQQEAVAHNKQTGHTNFREVQR